MKKITDFLGKPVLSLYESVTQGIVKDLFFDKNFKKLKYIVMFDDNEFQEEKIINVADIYSYGENAIVVKNNACIELKNSITSEISNPINNRAYTTLGKFLGIVTDVLLDDKQNVYEIELDNSNTIDIKQVVTSGKDAMFIQDGDNIIKLANFKSKTISNSQENKKIKVQILKEESKQVADVQLSSENLQEVNIEEQNNSLSERVAENENDTLTQPIKPRKKVELNETCLPVKSTTKNNFLIGRKVQRNIYSFNHELIIKKNTRITEKTILTAKSHSKLKELSLYSI